MKTVIALSLFVSSAALALPTRPVLRPMPRPMPIQQCYQAAAAAGTAIAKLNGLKEAIQITRQAVIGVRVPDGVQFTYDLRGIGVHGGFALGSFLVKVTRKPTGQCQINSVNFLPFERFD